MNHFDENHLGANFAPREPRSGKRRFHDRPIWSQLTRPGSASSQVGITAGHLQPRRMKKARPMVGPFNTTT
jgi:hypothetical protein